MLGRLGLGVASLLVGVAILEIGLRGCTPFPIHHDSNRRPDALLGYVLSEKLPGVDERGFRASGTSLEAAEIVVVGDSHVYGVNVAASDAFPAVLSRLTGRSVYNMGVGSYGVYQYAVLLDELLDSSATDVVVAFYLANDLARHCVVTTRDGWSAIEQRWGLFEAPACGDDDGWEPTPRRTPRERFALVGVISALLERAGATTPDYDAYEFRVGQRISVHSVKSHAIRTDLGRQGVRRNHQNAERIFAEAAKRMREAGIRLSVLLVPSRAEVLEAWARGAAQPIDPTFAERLENLALLKASYLEFFSASEIRHRDALPAVLAAFREEIEDGRDFYPIWDNGHPFERGYEAYATAAAELVRQSR